jgi:hypothetical protein
MNNETPDQKTGKKYLFNEHGICMNPDTEVFYSKNKCSVAFEYAKLNNGWVYGTEFWMTLNTTEAYGVHADGCWIGQKPLTLVNCFLEATKLAIDFFEEPGRKKHCSGVLKALHDRLTKLKQLT